MPMRMGGSAALWMERVRRTPQGHYQVTTNRSTPRSTRKGRTGGFFVSGADFRSEISFARSRPRRSLIRANTTAGGLAKGARLAGVWRAPRGALARKSGFHVDGKEADQADD